MEVEIIFLLVNGLFLVFSIICVKVKNEDGKKIIVIYFCCLIEEFFTGGKVLCFFLFNLMFGKIL